MKQIIVISILTMLGVGLTSQLRELPVDIAPVLITQASVPEPVSEVSASISEIADMPPGLAKPAETPAPSIGGGSVEQIVREAARKYGLDEEHFVRIAKCESGMTPTSVNYNYNENGYPSGLFQHLSGYWPARAEKYGYAGASVFDPVANANVTAGMFRDGASNLWECR